MESSIRLGRIGGVEVGLNWSVIVVLALVTWSLASGALPLAAPGQGDAAYWLAGALGAVVFAASLLVHELGHAFVARRSGVNVSGITLWLFGGVARLSGDAASPGNEFRVAVVGPLVSIGIAVLCGAAALLFDNALALPLLAGVFGWLAAINLLLAVFNLVPAFPLDGGRILRAILWKRTHSRRRATAMAARAGRFFGFVLMAVGLLSAFTGNWTNGLWFLFLGWFLMGAARAEESNVLLRGALVGITVGDVMTPDPIVAPDWLTVDDFVQHYVLTHHLTAFPLTDLDGRPTGLITLPRLKLVPPANRATTRVREVALPIAEALIARRDQPLVDILDGLSQHDGRALVVEADRVVGIISPIDVARALELAQLKRERETRDAGTPPSPTPVA